MGRNGIFHTMADAMIVSLDAKGRLVVPKKIRQQAGLKPGLPLSVSFRGGRVEIEPAPREVRVMSKGSLRVASPEEPPVPLTSEQVEKTLMEMRERREPVVNLAVASGARLP